jgi:transposase
VTQLKVIVASRCLHKPVIGAIHVIRFEYKTANLVFLTFIPNYINKTNIVSRSVAMKGVELTPRKKNVVVALSNEGLSSREIAIRVGFDQSTIVRLLQKYRQTGDVVRTRGRDRKRLTIAAEDRYLIRLSLKNRRASSADLKRTWQEGSGVTSSARTVRRRLLTAGLPARRPRRKPLLSQAMRAARLKWAKQHSNWTAERWSQVIFSDESKFNLHGSDGVQYVRRRSGEELHPDCITSTVKHPAGQMVWGCISSRGVGRLHFIEGTVNANVYIGILQTKLLPTIRDTFFSERNCTFQDDSAPCHRAKKVNEFLDSAGVVRLPWPGNSPDLNPIENCWKVIGCKLGAKKPRNKRELKEAIIHVWHHELNNEYINKLITSMPARIKAVIKAKGGFTKY